MRTYTTYEDIEKDLKLLDLERKIAFEELIGVKQDFIEITKPFSLLQSFFKLGGKYVMLLLVKKIFK